MGNNLKTIVYLTTNLKNNKIYIGVHNTDNPDVFDGYLGCGINRYHLSDSFKHPACPFQYAVKKYGFDAFKRITLAVFNNREDALKLESILVDEKFIQRKDTYNITVGGGAPPIYKKSVCQYDLNGNFIAEYNSELEAQKKLHIKGNITEAILYKTRCNNFYWTEYKVEKLNLTDFADTTQKQVIYVYKKSGEFFKEFESILQFCKEYNVSLGCVQRAIKLQGTIKNFYISKIKVDNFSKKITTKHFNDPVFQYALDGTFIKAYNNIAEVVKTLGKTYNRISTSIKLQSTCGGFQWSWERVEKMPNKVKNVYITKKIGQYDLNGNFIKEWNSVRACRIEFGNVSRVLRGHAAQCKGFTFKYIE